MAHEAKGPAGAALGFVGAGRLFVMARRRSREGKNKHCISCSIILKRVQTAG